MNAAETVRAKELLAELVSKPDATIDEYRVIYDRVCATFELPDDAAVERVDAGGADALWVSAPGVAETSVAVVVHGGGFVMGSAQGYRELGYRLSKSGDLRALVVDYRLAPEAPFPAPVDDVVAAYRYARSLEGVDNVFLVGDSAGGGLVMSALISLRDSGEQMPEAAVVLSPLVDLAGESASLTERAHLDPLPAAQLVSGMGGLYLNGLDPRHPVASPLHGDLSGLPPTFVLVGTDEGLHDDSIRLADRLEEAGADVKLEIGEGLPHIWPIFSFHPEAVAATDRIGAFLRSHVTASR